MIAAEASVRALVAEANEIYSQVGVVLDLGDRITVTNIPAAYNLNEVNEAEGRWNLRRLADLATNTGGLECYFVNRIVADGDDARVGGAIIGAHVNAGLVIAASGTGITLAHEIGHAFGMRDVYSASESGLEILGATCSDWLLDDWNGGCLGGGEGRFRYYGGGRLQRDIIRGMLMDGEKVDAATGFDITYGAVWGFDEQGAQDCQDTGFFTNTRRTDDPQHR